MTTRFKVWTTFAAGLAGLALLGGCASDGETTEAEAAEATTAETMETAGDAAMEAEMATEEASMDAMDEMDPTLDESAGAMAEAESMTMEAIEEARYVKVKMETSFGSIMLELDRESAPVSVENFLGYVDDGAYDGTIFHRVIDGFMIQGGGFEPDMDRRPTKAPITNEWRNGLTNARGTIAMARTGDPNSATNQFFINVVDNDRLSQPISGGAGYAVFGQVVEGMDVVDAIKGTATGIKAGMQDVPLDPVIITSVTRAD